MPEQHMEKNKNHSQAPQDENSLRKVRLDKLHALQEEGKDPFRITTYDQTYHTQEVKDHFEELCGEQDAEGNYIREPATVSLAGRMMFKRVMGKASFANIQDRDGRIQIYVSRNDLGDADSKAQTQEEQAPSAAEVEHGFPCNYADFKHLDIGDIIGVKGFPFKTRTGEISIHVKELKLLSKSLEPLPEKFHGLTDTDTRYRQRYVDLIMNEDVRETFKKRSAIIAEIRTFLAGRGFMEVETPILVDNAGGAAARPFVTHYNALNEDKKLRISLELYLKRLIVGGLERVYEIGRVFRNEGLDQRHNPEFTLMELYQAYTDYNGMMELTESMYRDVAQKVLGTTAIYYGDKEAGSGVEIDLGKPFRRLTMVEAIKEETGVDFDQVTSDEEAKALAKERGIAFEERHKKGDIVNLFFDTYCEDKMIQPTFILDHPIEISPLTKKKPDDPSKVERFELYINGWEMCNAYSELNDPIDQRARFAAQDANAAAGDEEAEHTDEDFLHAMEIGMPPTGGIGYGIDRFVMLLTNSAAIRDVLLFPTLKSIKAEKSDGTAETAVKAAGNAAAGAAKDSAAAGAAKDSTAAGAAKDSTAAEAAEGSTAPVDAGEAAGSVNDAKGFFTPNDKIDFDGVKVEDFLADQVDFETFQKSDFRAVKVRDCKAVPKSKKLLQFTLDDGTGTDRTILSGIHAYYEPEELIGKTLIAIVNLPARKMMGIDSCGMIISAVDEKDGQEDLHVLMVDNHIPAGAKLC